MVAEIIAGIGIGVLIAAVPCGIGGLLLYFGWNRLSHGVMLVWSDERSVAEAESAGGRLQLVGAVASAGETIESPIDGKECVVYRYEIDEYQQQGDGEMEWQQVEQGSDLVPFLLEDDSGSILVAPEDYQLWLNPGHKIEEQSLASSLGEAISGLGARTDPNVATVRPRSHRVTPSTSSDIPNPTTRRLIGAAPSRP